MVPCKSTAKEVSFEWSHHRISSIDSKVRTILHVFIGLKLEFNKLETTTSWNTVSDVASGDRDLLRAGDREVDRLSDRERRPRFLDEGDLERLRDFFRLESAGEDVWLLLFFFFSFGSIAWWIKVTEIKVLKWKLPRKNLLRRYRGKWCQM